MTARTPGLELGYLPALDGLRGIAVALVVWHHMKTVLRHLPGFVDEGHLEVQLQGLYQQVFWRISGGAWIGVDLFLVLSGFLITTLLLMGKSHPHQLRIFWIRRSLRIFPLAWLYMLTLFGLQQLDGILGHLPTLEGGWWMYFIFLANFHLAIFGWQINPLNILWSLALEEQFYALWPLAVRFLATRRLVGLCLGLVGLAPVARVLAYTAWGFPAAYVLSLGRVDALAMGALLAVALASPSLRERVLTGCKRWFPLGLLVLAVGLNVPFGHGAPAQAPLYFVGLGYSWIAACFVLLVGAAIEPGPWMRRVLTQPVITYVGKRCYGFYVWHVLAGEVALHAARKLVPGLLTFSSGVALWLVSIALAATLSWSLFERPILQLKDRYSLSQGPRSRAG